MSGDLVLNPVKVNAKDQTFLENYFALYRRLLLETDIKRELLAFRDLCLEVKARGNKLIFAGNGASASISSHAATDYTQHGKVRAITFNDHNLITAFGNDYGYEHWVERALEVYADPGDVVVLISSSGSSPNIVNAARYAQARDLRCVTFSGFSENNPLRALGQPGLWLDCNAYNVVESTHLIWILLVVNLLENDDGDDDFIERGLATIAQALTAPEHQGALLAFRDICREVALRSGKLIFAGNGGSASIASHAATDFTKQSRVRSIAFNDHNLLTCFANDYGLEHWMAQAVEAYAEPQDAVVLISSSGRSANVLNAANLAKHKDLPIITFTAFDPRNPLRKLGNVNFWADSHHYSIAEGLHSAWTFCVADMLVGKPIF
ncbi:MAG: SIS domain-containing protein [Thiocapsa sp.]|uniref:SIS domain-containing protein n=1 Tax=Thiocapsa sp. TaxID=2024551 RepID=UPI001BCCA2C7|nr:SIS domain-containing protein [Thiocapsa sp.]QVL50105.1 MAG: SIS domain-containing protein [Thiocapsa sp.]